MSRSACWLISGALLGWCARAAWQAGRHPPTQEHAADEADLAPLGARMARARSLAELVLSRSLDPRTRAVAERWLAALAADGPWSGFARESGAAPVAGEAWTELDDGTFERRAVLEMREWLESAHACCDALPASASPELRERVGTALAEVETSLRHLDAVPRGDNTTAFQLPAEG